MSRSYVYKGVGDHALALHVFRPEEVSEDRPAVVFYFGGGWATGTVNQFAPHAQYFAARGMVAVVADYRVSSRHGTTPFDSVVDACTAMRWVRVNASRLGVSPEKIVASGGSAGGHLAACTAFADDVSSRPTALILFNPVLDLIPIRERHPELEGRDYLEISPFHNITANGPPAIIFHGRADELIDFECSKRFSDAYIRAGNQCTLCDYQGQGHGFFNLSRSRELFVDTVGRADRFLVDLGLLSGPPDTELLRSMPVDTRVGLVRGRDVSAERG